jgi:methylated-DNA-[protein]-cysteine S-methyltransferase
MTVTDLAAGETTAYQTLTAIGPFSVLADGEAVRAAGFTASVEQLARLAGIEPERVVARGGDHRALRAVQAYFAGDLSALDAVETLDRPGAGRFQSAARQALRKIPAGSAVTYTQLADAAGNPRAVRAAGGACARNPIALIVPCHRVVRTDGTLGGYLYGLDIKRALLEHERMIAAGRSNGVSEKH